MSHKRKDWCKHYNGMSGNKSCRAGVLYEIFKGKKTEETPCWEEQENSCCDKAEYRTPEEIETEEKRFAERMANIGKAREAIVNHLGGPWKRGTPGSGGKIPCPVCETGTLAFSRAGYNGHIHASCDTDGCVSWME